MEDMYHQRVIYIMETVYWRHHNPEDLVYRKTRLRLQGKFLNTDPQHQFDMRRDYRIFHRVLRKRLKSYVFKEQYL